jgi:hypothetical protein
MRWRDIFARLLMVLRSRLSRHRTCGECGWLLTKTKDTGWHRGGPNDPRIIYEWECQECEEVERLEAQEKTREEARVDLLYKDWLAAKDITFTQNVAVGVSQGRILLEARALAGCGRPLTH